MNEGPIHKADHGHEASEHDDHLTNFVPNLAIVDLQLIFDQILEPVRKRLKLVDLARLDIGGTQLDRISPS